MKLQSCSGPLHAIMPTGPSLLLGSQDLNLRTPKISSQNSLVAYSDSWVEEDGL